jgi:hypothetical protein
LFLLFSFVGRGLTCPRATLDYLLREWVWELHVVHVAQFGLQVYAGSFNTGGDTLLKADTSLD